MDKSQKQSVINAVTNEFRRRQWFNGCGFDGDILIIAYNFYPAFEMVDIRTQMTKYGVPFELRDIRNVLPGSQKDDVPDYIKQ